MTSSCGSMCQLLDRQLPSRQMFCASKRRSYGQRHKLPSNRLRLNLPARASVRPATNALTSPPMLRHPLTIRGAEEGVCVLWHHKNRLRFVRLTYDSIKANWNQIQSRIPREARTRLGGALFDVGHQQPSKESARHWVDAEWRAPPFAPALPR